MDQAAIRQLEEHLRRQPGDWDSWLVYADWLLEQGDARGAFIMHTHTLGAERLSKVERRERREAIRDILDQTPLWAPDDAMWEGARAKWRFGFLVGVRLSWRASTLQQLAGLCALPIARFLTKLDLSSNHLDPEDVRMLANAESLRMIRHLILSYNDIGADGTKALAESAHLRSLDRLDLSFNQIGDEGVAALVRSENVRTLTRLDLTYNRIRTAGVRALANSEHLCSLSELSLRGNFLDEEEIEILSGSVPLRGCRVWLWAREPMIIGTPRKK